MPDSKAENVPPTRSSSSRRIQWIAFGVALLPFLGLAWRLNTLVDDAYIVFRFAENLVAGHGLNFNPGVQPPVEGYTQFLWVIWNAGLVWLGLDELVWSRVCLVAAGIGLLFAFARSMARRDRSGGVVAIAATLFLGALPQIGAWATGGMETMALTLFTWLAYDRLLGEPERPRGLAAGGFMALMVLTRADAPILVALIAAGAGASWLFRGRSRALLRASALAVGIAVMAALGYEAFRLAYFGELLSNTAYTKISFTPVALERGLNYVTEFFLTFPFLLLVLVLGFASLRRPRPAVVHGLIVVTGSCAYAVAVGGDFMTWQRFLVPMLPFVALVFAGLLARGWERTGPARPWLLAGVLCLIVVDGLPAFGVYPTPTSLRARFHYNWNLKYLGAYEQWRKFDEVTKVWVDLGRALALHTKPGESLVIGTIGAVGYYSGLFIYDQNGLVEPSVAHGPPATERRSPGHDKHVPPTFFLPERPTYLSSALLPRAAAEALVETTRSASRPARWKHCTWEAYPLSTDDGFPRDSSLALCRLHGEHGEHGEAKTPPVPSGSHWPRSP